MFRSCQPIRSFHSANSTQAISSVNADDDSPLKELNPDNDAKADADLSFLDVSHAQEHYNTISYRELILLSSMSYTMAFIRNSRICMIAYRI